MTSEGNYKCQACQKCLGFSLMRRKRVGISTGLNGKQPDQIHRKWSQRSICDDMEMFFLSNSDNSNDDYNN